MTSCDMLLKRDLYYYNSIFYQILGFYQKLFYRQMLCYFVNDMLIKVDVFLIKLYFLNFENAAFKMSLIYAFKNSHIVYNVNIILQTFLLAILLLSFIANGNI